MSRQQIGAKEAAQRALREQRAARRATTTKPVKATATPKPTARKTTKRAR